MNNFVPQRSKVYPVENTRFPYIKVDKFLDKESYHPVWVGENGLYKQLVCNDCFISNIRSKDNFCNCLYKQTQFDFSTEQKCIDWLKSQGINVDNPIWIIPGSSILDSNNKLRVIPAKII